MEYFDSVISETCTKSTEKFWQTIQLWLKNPHLINRRILASSQLKIFKLKNVNSTEILKWFMNFQEDLVTVENIEKTILVSLEMLNGKDIAIQYDLNNIDYSQNEEEKTIYLRFDKLLPRHTDKFSETLAVSLIDIQHILITQFFQKYNDDNEKKSLGFMYPYQIKYENDCISVLVKNLKLWKDNANLAWLKNKFFYKFLKWVQNEERNNSLINESLKHVESEKYTNLYNKLKVKYGIEMVKVWPERTDPQKFVYEDIAIASYLLLLWESEREKLGIEEKQSFLDLGCGNGLLVYILNSEGHPGFGIDLRKRKIWDLYPKTTRLQVKTIIPSSKSLFPETDWLIGNHSDELTPWIPVIAARSSYNCRFFLLPCCAYEFNGKKYQRDNTASSQYSNYLEYIGEVSRKCGFTTDIDKLRIPSTKRICLLGTERNYSVSDSDAHDLIIQEMIDIRSNNDNNNEKNEAWSNTFRPRDATERVRNCTQIDKGLITRIIDIVVSYLLHEIRRIDVFHADSTRSWNAGGHIQLSDIAKSLDTETLRKLKNECGGLQTLLRNNGHIFKVESGKVRFRVPGKDAIGKNKKPRNPMAIRKVKTCWFHENHPDGCPQTDNECDYKH